MFELLACGLFIAWFLPACTFRVDFVSNNSLKVDEDRPSINSFENKEYKIRSLSMNKCALFSALFCNNLFDEFIKERQKNHKTLKTDFKSQQNKRKRNYDLNQSVPKHLISIRKRESRSQGPIINFSEARKYEIGCTTGIHASNNQSRKELNVYSDPIKKLDAIKLVKLNYSLSDDEPRHNQTKINLINNICRELKKRKELDSFVHKKSFGHLYRSNSSNTPTLSISFPSHLPAMDLILSAGSNIFLRSRNVVSTALTNIQAAFGTYRSAILPLLSASVTRANNEISTGLRDLFTNTLTKVQSDVTGAIVSRGTGTNAAVSSGYTMLNTTLTERIQSARAEVDQLVSSTTTSALSDINNSIVTGNNNIYSRILGILSDPTILNPILPQIAYPDPTTGSNVFINGYKNLYSQISTIMSTTMTDMQTTIRNTVGSQLNATSTLINTINPTITAGISSRVTTLLSDVKNLIDRVTEKEIAEFNSLVSTQSNLLNRQIQGFMLEIQNNINSFVRSASTETITRISSLMSSNLANVLSQLGPLS